MTEAAGSIIKFDILDLPRRRLHQGRNIISANTGDPGSGKSFGAISVGERLRSDVDFSIDNVVFGFTEFMDRFTECGEGDLMVYEEAGAEFGARSAMSWDNREFSKILQVFRFKQVPCIFTLPHMMMLDKNGRRLLNYWQKSRYVNRKLEMGVSKFFVIKPDDWGDEIHRYYVRVRDDRLGIQVKLDPIGLPKPGEKIVSEYLKKKAEYFQAVVEMIKSRQGTLAENYSEKGPAAPVGIPGTENRTIAEWEEITGEWEKGRPSELEFKRPPPSA